MKTRSGASRGPARAAGWTCPDCKRRFGRKNQSHSCAPSGSVDDFFAARPKEHRSIYDAVEKHLRSVGPVHINAVKIGVFFKRTRTFAEVRAKKNCVVLAMLLSRSITHPKITKSLKLSANRTAIFIDLANVKDLDGEVRGWLTEAYLDSPP